MDRWTHATAWSGTPQHTAAKRRKALQGPSIAMAGSSTARGGRKRLRSRAAFPLDHSFAAIKTRSLPKKTPSRPS